MFDFCKKGFQLNGEFMMKFRSALKYVSVATVMLLLFASCKHDVSSSSNNVPPPTDSLQLGDDWFPLGVGKIFVYGYRSIYYSSRDTFMEKSDRTIELLSRQTVGNGLVYQCRITTKHITPYQDSVEVITGSIYESNVGRHSVSADFDPFSHPLIRDSLRRYPANDPSGTRRGLGSNYYWTFKKDVGLVDIGDYWNDPNGSWGGGSWTLK
jgi:hypothetical protein